MSNQESAGPIAPVADGCARAEAFMVLELLRLRKTLRITQIMSVVSVVCAGGYLIYVTNHFKASLEPVEAATIASSLIDQKVEEQTDQMSDYEKKEVPEMISQAPDYVLKHVPDYRKDLEQRIDAQFVTFASSTKEKFGQALDTFLDTNKDSVGTLLQNGNDPAATKTIVNQLNVLFHQHLKMDLIEGESIQHKLDASLNSLARVDERMKRLAAGKNLTQPEQSARRAIAVMLKSIDEKKVEPVATSQTVTQTIPAG
jgi:hypothetical protein